MIKYQMTNDVIFKKVLEDMEIVSYVIELITGIKLNPKGLKLLPQEMIDYISNKKSVLDVRVSYNEEYEINLEMQKNKVGYSMIDRVIYYSDKMNVIGTPSGTEYKSKKIISICFIDFEDEKCKSYLERYQYKNSDNYIKLDNKQIYIVDIRKSKDIENRELRRLIELMGDKEIEKYKKEGDMMEKIVNAIYHANMDPVEAYNMMQREKAENDYNISMELAEEEGLSLGEAKGKAETESRIVKRLISSGLSLTEIEALTGIKVGMMEE